MLDHPNAPGGTGLTVDRSRAARLARRAPCLLAGGLDPSNVEQRVAAVRPAGVDAASRLERAPGRKDLTAMTRFVQRSRRALTALNETIKGSTP